MTTNQILAGLLVLAFLLAVTALLMLLGPTKDPSFGRDVEQACALTEPAGVAILPTDSPEVVRFLTTPGPQPTGKDHRR